MQEIAKGEDVSSVMEALRVLDKRLTAIFPYIKGLRVYLTKSRYVGL